MSASAADFSDKNTASAVRVRLGGDISCGREDSESEKQSENSDSGDNQIESSRSFVETEKDKTQQKEWSIVITDDIPDDNDDDDNSDAVPSNELCVGNREGESELVHAVRLDHCDRVRQLIRSGADCNALCKWEGVPCTVRVQRGDFRKQLQMTGYSALHVAVIHSSLKTIKCLVSMGADINVRDKNERTPLQLAVAVNRLTVAQLLIDLGAELNTRSVSGRSPLMEAVSNLSLELTQRLLDGGANPDLMDIKGTTPLWAAISAMPGPNQNQEIGRNIAKCLIDAGCGVDRTNLAGASALMFAAGLKMTNVLPMLIEAGANVNRTDRAGCTAFSMAIEGQRNMSTVTTLMQYGAATHTADCKGQTPLSKVLRYGSVTLLRLLLSADAVPHDYDILTKPRIVQIRKFMPEFDSWIHEELFQPRSLRRLCREGIRQQMSPNNLPRLEELQLPKILNSFILGAD